MLRIGTVSHGRHVPKRRTGTLVRSQIYTEIMTNSADNQHAARRRPSSASTQPWIRFFSLKLLSRPSSCPSPLPPAWGFTPRLVSDACRSCICPTSGNAGGTLEWLVLCWSWSALSIGIPLLIKFHCSFVICFILMGRSADPFHKDL